MPYVVLGGAQIAVGAGAIFARYALGGAGPLAVSAARLAIAAVILLSVTALRGTRVRVSLTRAQQGILALAGLALAAHFATWIWSLEYTSVAVSVLLVATTPIWTAIYDAVFHGHRLSPTAMAAFAGGDRHRHGRRRKYAGAPAGLRA
jgi:drug/metabolite transporter (DMT)-like permease